MRNNNQAIVRRITGRSLRMNKKRNFFIITAIALTAFMIASTFSVGMGFYETMAIMPFRFEGTRTHMGFMGLNQSQIDTMRNSDYVRHIAFGIPVNNPVGRVMLSGFDDGMTMIYTDRTSWDEFQTPTFTSIRGRRAEAENEIMLSRTKLARMGIHDPYVGMAIPLDFTIHGSDEIHHKTFILSTFYTEFVSVSGGAYTPVFISQAFAQRHGRYVSEEMGVNVLFRNNRNAYEYSRRLVQELSLTEEQFYEIHPAVLRGVDVNFTTMFTSIGIIVAFLMLVGFLLIYNVMFISVSKDVRFYGLLKTLGTTPRQLRRIVNGQVLWMFAIGLPIGLGAAAAASLVLVPAFVTVASGAVVSFSPVIYVGGGAFTLFTAYLGAFTSAKKAAQVSPIEAVRYSGEVSVRIKPRTSAKGKPWRMAWRNVFRGRKQAVIVLMSLFLGITVFTSAMTFVFSFDIESNLDEWYPYDFMIQGMRGDWDIMRELSAALPHIYGVAHVDRLYATWGGAIPALNKIGSVVSLDTDWALKLYPDLDVTAFERGETALLEHTLGTDMLGREYNKNLHIGTIADIKINGMAFYNVQIAGRASRWLGHGLAVFSEHHMPMAIIMSNVYLQQYFCDMDFHLNGFGINVYPGTDSYVHATLYHMLGDSSHVMRSRYEARQAMEEARFTIFVLGVGISAILGTIGVFNFINVISVGLLVRKREFAALESVGMSKKQMRSMLRFEGAVYWILSIAASLSVGTGVAYGVFSLINSADPTSFPYFNYPIIAVAVAYVLIVVICTIVPELAYKNMSKLTLVERLREAE